MGKIYDSVEELIGGTPLVRLHRLEQRYHLDCQILAKLERQNPGGSVKDRAAVQMLDDAQERGILPPGSVIIEPTSGNTGIGLAMVCAVRGYRCIIVMPDTMSIERRKLMRGYGAELVLTPGAEGMQGAVKRAEELAAQIPNSFLPGQFSNPSNALAHYRTTGPEIWQDTDGRVDLLVAGVGTGGTITGVGRYLKEQNPSIHIIAAEPATSPLLSQGYAASHGIQGIGANFIPSVLDTQIYDEVIPVTDHDAMEASRMAGTTEGLLVGISSGAALWAAVSAASRPENIGKRLVVILPDTGERYLSTPLFPD